MSQPRSIVLAVVGDPGAGKTSLVRAACHADGPHAAAPGAPPPPPVLPPCRFPAEVLGAAGADAPAELLVVDTAGGADAAARAAREAALRAAAGAVVCLDPAAPGALARLRSHWLPRVARLSPGAPVVVAVCKDDLDPEGGFDQEALREAMEGMVAEHPSLEVAIKCSAAEGRGVGDVFYHALKAVLFPKAPLLDAATGRLTTACVKALLRIFLMCDADQDGALGPEELAAFQALCFGAPLSREEAAGVRGVVAEGLPEGVGEAGLLFPGFLYLHTLFLTQGRPESVWAVLTAFGYGRDLSICDAALAHLPAVGPDEVLELSPAALAYLAHAFDIHDSGGRGVLSGADAGHLFSRAPVAIYEMDLWNRTLVAGPPADAAGAGGGKAGREGGEADSGGVGGGGGSGGGGKEGGESEKADSSGGGGVGPEAMTKEGFLTRWRAFALQEPRLAFEQMMYLGLGGRRGEGAAELFERRRRRRRRRRAALLPALLPGAAAGGLAARSTLLCAVFGGLASGKSSFVAALAAPGGAAGGAGGARPRAGLLSAAAAVAVAGSSGGGGGGGGAGGGGAGGAGGDVTDVKTLVLVEVSSAAAPDDPMTDLRDADVAAVVFDAHDSASFATARALAAGLGAAPGGEGLPVVLVAAKSDLGCPEELRAAIASACAELRLPPPLPVAVAAGALGRPNAFRCIAEAALRPAGRVPDTPEQRLRRRKAWAAAGALVAAAAAGYVAYRISGAAGSGGGGSDGGGGGAGDSGGGGGSRTELRR
ncbi:hypothetical protein Rsub_08689 [Raphidocelis subcapitata]|uniref:EF hand associated type-2 domain-containing protein n=1 Tax=Raphidocelis subcapitata TaxID=307507 RepID=A0A2V0PEV3_9CHLO|nr:hypothetical protein Rsub_08689 [Raphidocelis subcapitata]|eukprot:GBF95707.1 hypothetical protein Rsub_08689 [Raphidocelis subcapitata]